MGSIIIKWVRAAGHITKFFPRVADSKLSGPDHHINRGWKILGYGLGLFMLWAIFAPLDRGVTVPAYVISDGERKVVQHLAGGIIDKILVKEGDFVKQGQPLVLMNTTNPAAKEGSTSAAIQTLDETIQQKEKQLSLLNQQVANMNSLSADGYVPRNRALELERSKYQLQDSLAADKGRRTELIAQLPAAQFDLANTEVKSPVDGYVVGLSVFTNGGVIGPGAKMMEIAPLDPPLVVSGEMPVHLIDKVHTGLPVNMQFTAFNQNRTPHIPGLLTVVGNDRLIDDKTGAPYYKVQAMATESGMTLLGSLKVRPGMPVDIFIKTGERTLLSYLLKPLWDRAHSAMRED